jgi:methionine synthase II (cobalamin-independent)
MARDLNGDHGEYQELEDAKTLKAVMFLMIQEHVRNIPNDQELGTRIRKIINKFNEDN